MMQAKRSRGTRTPCLLDGLVRLGWPGLGNGQLKVELCPGLPRIWGTGQSGVSRDDVDSQEDGGLLRERTSCAGGAISFGLSFGVGGISRLWSRFGER